MDILLKRQIMATVSALKERYHQRLYQKLREDGKESKNYKKYLAKTQETYYNYNVGNEDIKRHDGGIGSGNHNHAGILNHQGGSTSKGVSATGANIPCKGFRNKKAAKKHEKHWKEFGFTSHEQYEKAAIAFLQQPVGGDIDGYMRKDGCIVRFNRKTGEIGFGYPGKHVKSYFKLRYDEEKGKVKIKSANRRFDKFKKDEAYEEKQI